MSRAASATPHAGSPPSWEGAQWRSGDMAARMAAASAHLQECTLCPHRCGTARATAEGRCRVGRSAYVASEMMHMGEEEILRPAHAIFLSGCTATCHFCTAARFAFHPTYGVSVTPELLAERILQRQNEGARSVAFIGGDPVPHIPFLVAVRAALGDRLRVPLVLNSNLYVTAEALALLDGIVDIYLPDLKFGPPVDGPECGETIGGMPDYWRVVTGAIGALHVQGKQLVVRHLLMPGHFACCTEPVLGWLARFPDLPVSLLTQYLAPARIHGPLSRPLAQAEIDAARNLAANLGLALVR